MQKVDEDRTNALRLACKELAHAHDYGRLIEEVRMKHGYEYPHHTVLGYRFAGQMLQWKAVVMELSGNDFDFVEAVDDIIDDDSFETGLEDLLAKHGFKKESIHDRAMRKKRERTKK